MGQLSLFLAHCSRAPVQPEHRRVTRPQAQWPVSIWGDAQHHQSSGKCSQNHGEVAVHIHWGWLSLQKIINVGEDVEKLEPSYVAIKKNNGTTILEGHWQFFQIVNLPCDRVTRLIFY